MTKEKEEAEEKAAEKLRLNVFAGALNAIDWKAALKRYEAFFEKPEKEEDVEEFTPENPEDVREMLLEARKVGVIK